ncbi:hypothetical protein BU16DRAFT_317165 [Lophium mytilinum]|uniref:F-box domain-containing protein n=1 Tax=Lophium mytilinum TaxID=390894 RepID=A0A6A6R122_9PEZI|nr:hypothetical protein BU16DRAFT_317165 [Lophium mytilinum]
MLWISFAVELQQMILVALAQDGDDSSPYASVCRKWRDVIENKPLVALVSQFHVLQT